MDVDPADANGSGSLPRSCIRLSDYSSLPISEKGERMSYGSLAHTVKEENCKVCVFKRKNGVACRHGALCFFCHAEHKPYVRPPRFQRGAEKRAQAAERAAKAAAEAGDAQGAAG